MILPEAEWQTRTGLAALVAVLGDCRFVGGAVRDTLLSMPVADIDLATPIPPDAVLDRLRDARIRAVPTGLEHGTVTAVLDSGPVEVTTLRRDVSTDGRRATVAFTQDWREDAGRRDFTINALYADPGSGEVFDYHGGVADLDMRRIRFIGDPLQRIAEDHLRILRFFRFLARFGDVPDPAGLDACTARAKDLMALSRERVADELLKLLVARDAVRVTEMMLERGIFTAVLPEITSAERLASLSASEAAAGFAPNAIRRLAALLPPDPDVAAQVGARLKLSNVQRKRLVAAAGRTPSESPEALAYRQGPDSAADLLLLAGRSTDAAQVKDWTVPRLPISGGALVSRGLAKGPEVARALRLVEERWIAEGFPDAERVAVLADEAAAQSLRETR